MFYQIFHSLQVKRCAIITYKQAIYELPYNLPNNLRLKKLGNIRKLSKQQTMNDSPAPSPLLPTTPRQNEKLVNTRKKLLKNRN